MTYVPDELADGLKLDVTAARNRCRAVITTYSRHIQDPTVRDAFQSALTGAVNRLGAGLTKFTPGPDPDDLEVVALEQRITEAVKALEAPDGA